jgi:putative hemolysin
VKRAQKLRYKVFYKNGAAIADAATMLAQRDKDAFDKICDHLLVVDHAAKPTMSGKQPVVGTYQPAAPGRRRKARRLLHQ